MLKEATFPVFEAAVTYDTPKGDIPTNYKLIVRKDTNKILSCMTNDYKLVTNETIINYADPIIKKNNGKVKEVRTLNNGAKTIMKWTFPNDTVKIGPKDLINPEIIIRNSYDGTIGVNVMAGAFRLVCSNGMVIGVVLDDYKNKHSVHNMELDKLEEIITDTISKTKYAVREDFPSLIETKIQERHIIKFIEMFPLHANEIVTQMLIAKKPKTFWNLLNIGTNIITHKMNRNTEATHKLEGSLYPSIKNWAKKEIAVA